MNFVKVFLVWCVLFVGFVCYTWLYTPEPDSYGQDKLHFDNALNAYVVSDSGKTKVVTHLCWHSGAVLREGLSVSFVSFEDKFYVFPYELDEKTATYRGHMLVMTRIWLFFILGSCVGFVVLDMLCGEEKRKIAYVN